MNRVYCNSAINLSTANAEDDSQGLFFDRNPEEIGPLPVCPIFQNLDWRQLSPMQSDQSWHIVSYRFWEHLSGTSPVFPRAWIFQERFLSSRTLHFGREQVYWECRTHKCSETFPEGYPTRSQQPRSITLKFMYERLQNLYLNQIIPNKKIFWYRKPACHGADADNLGGSCS
jgi:hypothetical protein